MTRTAVPITFESSPAVGARVTPLVRSRLRTLVQSPLRAALLRHFHTQPERTFDLDGLVETFGRLRVDVDACLNQLLESGFARACPGELHRYMAAIPAEMGAQEVLDEFLMESGVAVAAALSASELRFREMIGRDEKMLMLFESIRTVAKTDLAVLILGPTGSGKEVVARLVHELSRRRAERFQAVNCAALPDTLFESELFGFERGAFTGAYERKPGRIELANKGTLFLDEIGDLALPSQAKLLRVVEERRVERLGGRAGTDVDFRLICATHRPLDAFVSEQRFREDLYYRINAFTVRLPSLRERPVDIPILANRFLESYCAAQSLPGDAKRFSVDAVARLTSYAWPGNIRELEATVSRAALAAGGDTIQPEHIQFLHPAAAQHEATVAADHPLRALRLVERDHIQRVLDATQWNKKRAARVLEIGRETLYRKIDEFELKPSEGVVVGAQAARARAGADVVEGVFGSSR
ncbi:MAG: sigma-54 interaction domain-containing protein [Vicinamibacterales bacterium]